MLTSVLHAETIEFQFLDLTMYRLCWRFLGDVHKACDTRLRRVLGHGYIENETQITFVVGYILMQTAALVPNLGPLRYVAKTFKAILDAILSNFVTGAIMK